MQTNDTKIEKEEVTLPLKNNNSSVLSNDIKIKRMTAAYGPCATPHD
jgi:hypothetical protein